MIPWTEIEMLQSEHRQRVQRVEQTYWMRVQPLRAAGADRWQWRAMNKVGGWLVTLGNRLQGHVEQARQMVYTSHIAMEAKSDQSHPCP
jgi:hypothetical protein